MADVIIIYSILFCAVIAAIVAAIVLMRKRKKKNLNDAKPKHSETNKKPSLYKKVFTFAFLFSFFHAFTKRNKKK